ncbi:MAG: RNA methyltransferase [Firmicutes bacterium]|nr:RNA methyltransferase [Bacillota bacterium]
MITSARNERVKFIRGLSEPQVRRRTACTVVEGIRLVEEALKSGAGFVLAAYDERMRRSERGGALLDALGGAGVELLEVSADVLKSVAMTESPQGIVAAIKVPFADAVAEVRRLPGAPGGAGEEPITVLLDGVQDPGNVGTIIRSADAFGAALVVLVNDCADPYNPKALRASMGSVFHLSCPVEEHAGPALDALAETGFSLYYGDASSAVAVYSARLTGRAALAVGSEAAGVSGEVRSRGTPVSVPIYGRAESLNAAMAMTAMLYEARRQRAVAL